MSAGDARYFLGRVISPSALRVTAAIASRAARGSKLLRVEITAN
jgi:hypothetical protein